MRFHPVVIRSFQKQAAQEAELARDWMAYSKRGWPHPPEVRMQAIAKAIYYQQRSAYHYKALRYILGIEP